MILKVCRQKKINEGDCGTTELVTEFYSGNTYKENSGVVIIGENSIVITSYDQLDEISGKIIHFETLNVYLMNDEGKTIERII